MDKRTRARELAMQALYQLDIQGPDLLGQLDAFFAEYTKDDLVHRLAYDWTIKTWENLQQCNEMITAASVKWKLSRLSYVDKSILRLSVCHLEFFRDIPPKVVINEAIELAKKFSTAQSPAFVNGVLDAVLKKFLSCQR